jgi:hypothetical protein
MICGVMIGEQTCAACKIFSNSCHFLSRVLRSRDTNRKKNKNRPVALGPRFFLCNAGCLTKKVGVHAAVIE